MYCAVDLGSRNNSCLRILITRERETLKMNGRAAAVGFPILFGGYLLVSNFGKSELYAEGPRARYASVLAAFGAFLILLSLLFLWRNLK